MSECIERFIAWLGKPSWFCRIERESFQDFGYGMRNGMLECLNGYDTLFLQMSSYGYRCSFILPQPIAPYARCAGEYSIVQHQRCLARHLFDQVVCSTMGFMSLGSGSTMRPLMSSSRFWRFNCFSCFLVGIRTDHQCWPKMLDLIASTQ